MGRGCKARKKENYKGKTRKFHFWIEFLTLPFWMDIPEKMI